MTIASYALQIQILATCSAFFIILRGANVTWPLICNAKLKKEEAFPLIVLLFGWTLSAWMFGGRLQAGESGKMYFKKKL